MSEDEEEEVVKKPAAKRSRASKDAKEFKSLVRVSPTRVLFFFTQHLVVGTCPDLGYGAR
jgi:hypothetical protein